MYASRSAWQEMGKESDVRLQWDPDHAPSGAKEERRAIQLGIRGEVLRRYAREWIVDIQDVSSFVAEQRESISALEKLRTPAETVYPIADQQTGERLGISHWEGAH